MAPAQGMRATQGYNLLVVEAHSVEDVPEVGWALGSIRQAAVRRALGLIVNILPARAPWDVRPCANKQTVRKPAPLAKRQGCIIGIHPATCLFLRVGRRICHVYRYRNPH